MFNDMIVWLALLYLLKRSNCYSNAELLFFLGLIIYQYYTTRITNTNNNNTNNNNNDT